MKAFGIIRDVSNIKKLEKDKLILKEKVERLTKKIHLTHNEKIVFYGLIKYPLLNDRELSETLGIKRSTVTAIKNKLIREKYFMTRAVPDFRLFGCENICIISGKIDEKNKGCSEMIFHLATKNEFVCFLVLHNEHTKKIIQEQVEKKFEKENLPTISFYSLKTSSMFWDYSPFIKKIFDLEINETGKTDEKTPGQKKPLKTNEKTMLYTLAKYPTMTDRELSEKTGISRPTVSKIKKDLLGNGSIRIMNIPDISRLQYELLVFSRCIKEKACEHDDVPPEILVCVTDPEKKELAKLSLFRNYTEYRKKRAESACCKEKDKIFFPLEQISVRDFDFAPIIKKVLDINEDV